MFRYEALDQRAGGPVGRVLDRVRRLLVGERPPQGGSAQRIRKACGGVMEPVQCVAFYAGGR